MFSSKKEYAKRLLTDAIISGEFAPGEYLRQNEIAARFNLSSTPVREAFAEMQMSGVLTHEAHRGFSVTSMDRIRIIQVFQVRKLIEIEAARLAATNATESILTELKALLEDMERQNHRNEFLAMIHTNDSFHRILFSLSGNEFLVHAIERLWSNLPRFAAWTLKGRRSASIKEHNDIYDALSERDPNALTQAYTTHLDNAEEVFINFLVQKPTVTGDLKK